MIKFAREALGVRRKAVRTRLTLYALPLTIFFSACSLTQRLADFTVADLRKAADIATKGNDPMVADCATFVADEIERDTFTHEAVGLVSAFEIARLGRRGAPAKREEFERKCSAFVMDVMIELGKKARR